MEQRLARAAGVPDFSFDTSPRIAVVEATIPHPVDLVPVRLAEDGIPTILPMRPGRDLSDRIDRSVSILPTRPGMDPCVGAYVRV